MSKERPERQSVTPNSRGEVILNADDWGEQQRTTDRILERLQQGRLSSASGMTFMADSERAADLAREHGADIGLHLNLTVPFTGTAPEALRTHQARIAKYLRAHRFAYTLYSPWLATSFEYVVRAQLEEYCRIYGEPPTRIDGHHHMHLSANVLGARLLPCEAIVRRNLTFFASEKSRLNRSFRARQDRKLAERHRITDYFFDVQPLTAEHLRAIFELCGEANVEIETHPGRDEEYAFLLSDELPRLLEGVAVARGYELRAFADAAPMVNAAAFAPAAAKPHIAVCLCTYKRPEMLSRILERLAQQRTEGLFTCSAVVADNDQRRSGEEAVARFTAANKFAVRYVAEPQRGISRARNLVMAHAEGDYLALLDDDELPAREWLLQLYRTRERYDADGVLGPVLRRFEHPAPRWLEKSHLMARPLYASGKRVTWRQSRTSSVLLKSSLTAGEAEPFNVAFRAGEDQDFFARKIAAGYRFVWSSQGAVHEVIPPARCRRRYQLRRALFQGTCELQLPSFGAKNLLRSVAALPIYTVLLPFTLLRGQARFMTLLEKWCYHAGKLLMYAGVNPVKEEYVSD